VHNVRKSGDKVFYARCAGTECITCSAILSAFGSGARLRIMAGGRKSRTDIMVRKRSKVKSLMIRCRVRQTFHFCSFLCFGISCWL
jgi:hypothetical protein